jgi:hypothetical protein
MLNNLQRVVLMNKFVYALLLSSAIFAQSAVAMQEDDQSHMALVKKNEAAKAIIGKELPSFHPGVRALITQYAGDFFKEVRLGSNFSYIPDDLIGMTFSVGALKVILEIDDAEGDLLPAPASTPTDTYFYRTTSFLYKGQEFQVKAYLPNAFISKRNYKDDEVIWPHSDCMYLQTNDTGQQYKHFYIPNRDICLLPKDRCKSWVGLPWAGLVGGCGERLDPDEYYRDGSINTDRSSIEVSVKPREEQKEEQKGS